jgi:hypothetical protein
VRKWPFMVRRYGRCCMYGPNYVKLSRVFAVQLFSMFIGHYAALPPDPRSDPTPINPTAMPSPPPFASLSPMHCNTRCSRLKPRQWQLRHVLTICTRIPERCAHPRPHRYASSLLPTDIGCGTSPLALDKTRQHTLRATQTSTVATTTCLDYLHSHTTVCLGSGNHGMSGLPHQLRAQRAMHRARSKKQL